MELKQRLILLPALCWVAIIGAYAQEADEADEVHYEAIETDYGYLGTTDAIFSNSQTIISTLSLTQRKPTANKTYPLMLSIWLHADALSINSQELAVKQLARAGTKTVDGQFPHRAKLLLANHEEVELSFSIHDLTQDHTHHTVMLTAPIADHTQPATYGELATKLRRHDIVTLSVANTTLSLPLLRLKTSHCLDAICRELLLAGCDPRSFSTPDSRQASDFDPSPFRSPRRAKSLDELLYHALGCFPSDIRHLKPATAIEIIRSNTQWLVDDDPDRHTLELTHEDGYDFTYHGLRIAAEMNWDSAQQLTGYSYYFKLYSKDKQLAKAHYRRLCDELQALGIPLQPYRGERGDKDPRQGSSDGYHVQTCYYLNVNDQYVIQLKITL